MVNMWKMIGLVEGLHREETSVKSKTSGRNQGWLGFNPKSLTLVKWHWGKKTYSNFMMYFGVIDLILYDEN